MKTLSISAAWNETTAFVKREAGLLFPVALAFLAVPSIVAQYFMPEAGPGQQPEPGAWMFLWIPLIVLTMTGSLAVSALALRPAQSVQEALAHAVRRLLPTLGAILLLSIASLIVAIPLIFVIGVAGLEQSSATLLMILVFLGIFTFLWIRLLLVTPVAVAEPVGPVAILKRSWRLTSGHFGKLIGFMTILALVAVIAILGVTLIFGTIIALLAGPPDPGSLSQVLLLIVSGIVSAIFSVYLTVVVARIYAQLAGGGTSGT